MSRQQKAARLRSLLANYDGYRFISDSSGGANGIIFIRNSEGKEYFIGGMPKDAHIICEALNLTMELLAARGSGS